MPAMNNGILKKRKKKNQPFKMAPRKNLHAENYKTPHAENYNIMMKEIKKL